MTSTLNNLFKQHYNLSPLYYGTWNIIDYIYEGKIVYRRLMGLGLKYFNDVALQTPCQAVTVFDESISVIIGEMKNVMSVHNGIGISANQCGFTEAIMLVKDKKGEVHTFINPVVIETEGMDIMSEGCLSAPEVFLSIARPTSVLLQYQDVSGETKKIMAEGIEARCILHEMEHLRGESFLKHVSRNIRKIALSKIKKYLKNNIAKSY